MHWTVLLSAALYCTAWIIKFCCIVFHCLKKITDEEDCKYCVALWCGIVLSCIVPHCKLHFYWCVLHCKGLHYNAQPSLHYPIKPLHQFQILTVLELQTLSLGLLDILETWFRNPCSTGWNNIAQMIVYGIYFAKKKHILWICFPNLKV